MTITSVLFSILIALFNFHGPSSCLFRVGASNLETISSGETSVSNEALDLSGNDRAAAATSSSSSTATSSSCPAMAEELIDLNQKFKELNSTLTQRCDSQTKGLRKKLAGLHEQLSINTKFQEQLSDCTTSANEIEQQLQLMNENHQDCEIRHVSLNTKFGNEIADMKIQLDNCTISTHEIEKELQMINEKSQDCQLKLKIADSQLQDKASLVESTMVESKEKLSRLESEYKQCQQNLLESREKIESSLETIETTRQHHSTLKSRQQIHIHKLEKQISSLSKDVGDYKKQIRSYQDKYHDTRDDVRRLERELLRMHTNAQSTYLNTTLIMTDLESLVSRQASSIFMILNDGLKQTLPYVESAKDYLSGHLENSIDIMYPWIEVLQDKFDLYIAPKYRFCRHQWTSFYLQNLGDTVDPIWEKYVTKNMERLNTAFEVTHLSIVSLMKESSRIGIQYIQLKNDSEDHIPSHEKRLVMLLEYVRNNASKITRWCWAFLVILCSIELGLVRLLRVILFLPFYPFRILWNKTKRI